MKCKLCDKEVERKFSSHLNSNHKTTKKKYLEMFPEQAQEYMNQIPDVWNKGLTENDHPSIKKYSNSMREFKRNPEERERQSNVLKKRYELGDILDKDTRAKVVKSGSDGWVKRLKESSDIEKKELLSKFTTAGNEAQNSKRHLLTPDDYNKRCVLAKGVARYHDCDFCGKQMIKFFGGKPRPNKKFCNKDCYAEFLFKNQFYVLKNTTKPYFSEKMSTMFCLRSNLELWFAKILDRSDFVDSWQANPFCINYEWIGKKRRYYPDFLVNNKYVLELKSDYIRKIQGEEITARKLKTAEIFCLENSYEFIYLQFNGQMTESNFLNDVRIVLFSERLKND